MSALQTLRNAHFITRLVLVWFALFIGASVASPLIKPQASQMVCSAMGGMKMVMTDDSGDNQTLSGGMDCPLCAHVSAPPPAAVSGFESVSALAHALRPIPAAHIAWLTGSPLPPRGPPALS
ncbi:DUF2946 family protein [Limnohabitans radicicola]|uniref:DUF2946 family protein n=1 Tax=Limnohabitans radicicola TaxID=2771427 RepID=A0A927FEF4_9BURK|nr:DUF2946 family protein [Limnohabitans radicicola]MBD8049844.1 DUF2946 family protein [Limnohabitans radicicola]